MVRPVEFESTTYRLKVGYSTTELRAHILTEVAYGEQLFSGRLGERQKKDIDRNISNRYYNHCIILYNNIIQILLIFFKFSNKKRSKLLHS